MSVFCLFPLLFFVTKCMILDFANFEPLLSATTEGSGNTSIFHQAMFSLPDAPMGKNWPLVNFDLKFKRTSGNQPFSVDVIIYTESFRGHIGVPITQLSMAYCCTEALHKKLDCKPNELILRSPDPKNSTHHSVLLSDNEEVSYSAFLSVNSTENFYIQITSCNGGYTVSGSATWSNPYGYLPGDSFMKLPFAGVMALLDLFLFTFFGVLMIRHRKSIIKLQWCTLGVCLVSSIDFSAWFFYRLHNNNEGHYHISALFFVVLLSTFKHTVFRVLVLLLAMGYGVVKWTLGHVVLVKLTILSIGFFVFNFVSVFLSELKDVGTYKSIDNWANLAILIPRALLELCFFYWILLSLIRTIQQLILRKQELKLSVYKSFMFIAIGICIAVLVFLLYMSFSITKDWKNKWLRDGVSDLLFYITLFSIVILWRPRKNNTLYGAESLSRGDDRVINTYEDDVAIPITEEFVFQGAKRRNNIKKDEDSDSHSKDNKSGREEYDNSRERTIVATGFNPEEHSTFTQSIMEFEIEEDDHQVVLDEINKLS